MLFKPKWEHKDPRIRAQAAAEIDDPALLEVLPALAAHDPDPEVRLQAARRVTDIHHIRALADQADDSPVRDHARRTLRGMLAGARQPSVDLATRLALLAEMDDPELIEHLAREGAESGLRKAAIERLTRAAVLGDIAIGDADPKLRQLAASRIEPVSTLERVAAKSRTVDKRVHKIVTESLARLRLEAGDPAELEKRANELCVALEQLTRSDQSRESKQAELDQLAQKWASLEAPPGELAARFLGARRIVEAAISGDAGDARARQKAEIEHFVAACEAPLESTDLDVLQRSIDSGEALRQRLVDYPEGSQLAATIAALTSRREQLLAEQTPEPALLELCERAERIDSRRARDRQVRGLQSDWEQAWTSIANHRPADQSLKQRFSAVVQRLEAAVAQRAERHTRSLERLEPTLATLETRLEEGDLAGAVKLKQQLLDDLAVIGNARPANTPEFKGRLNAARGRLRELRDWQHWANNKIRLRLCEEAEAMAGSGMHPDAVAEKAKALNAQWRAMEDSEHLPGDDPNRPANPGLRRRFQAACNRAFLPAKDYFKKRAEIREKHLEELNELCVELDTALAAAQDQDIRQLERTVSRARQGLRKLSGIPPRDRGAMSKRLREGANAIDQRLNAHYEVIEQSKQQIIDEVTALVEEPDLSKAVAEAKDAQRRWQQAGHCRRHREQKLWGLFRGASDQVFARLDEQRSEQKAERQAQAQALGELLAEARKLLKVDPQGMEDAEGEVRRLQDRWRQANCQDRRQETEFRGLLQDIEQTWERAREQRISERRGEWRDVALDCQRLEQRLMEGHPGEFDELSERWARIGQDAPETLARRVEKLLAPEPVASSPEEAAQKLQQALELCIRIEFLAGVDTPKKHHGERMKYQVKRLSQRMSGVQAPAPREEATAIEQQWMGCGPLPAAEAEPVNRRFLDALSAFGER